MAEHTVAQARRRLAADQYPDLSKAAERVLLAFLEEWLAGRRPVTIRPLGLKAGLSSSATYYQVNRLIGARYLRRDEHNVLTPGERLEVL